MSTRGAIARTTGDTFQGVYHHWDSYPEGLGQTLIELYRDTFARNLPQMLRTLINEHPAGWSTINGVDWSQDPGFVDSFDYACATCGKHARLHYRQYYRDNGINATPVTPTTPTLPADALPGVMVLGHQPIEPERSRRPQCFCHGTRGEKAWPVDEKNAAGSGVEYVYAFDEERRHMFVLSSYCEDGVKMIGMFGMGDSDARWRIIADVDLDSPSASADLARAAEVAA